MRNGARRRQRKNTFARTIYVQDVNLSSGKLGTSINAISDLGKFGAMMLTGETKNAKGEKVKLTDTEKKMDLS